MTLINAIKASDFDAYVKANKAKALEEHMARDILVLRQSDGRQYIPEPEREYRFHPHRKYRFDFAWPHTMIAIEVEGGKWQQTKTGRSKGHLHPVRFEEDTVKYNEATRLGWRVFRFTADTIRSGRALAFLETVFPPY